MHQCTDQCGSQKNDGFTNASTRRLEDRRDSDSTRIGKPLVIDHVFSERNDEGDAEECAGDTAKRQNHRIKAIPETKNKDRRDRKHHPR